MSVVSENRERGRHVEEIACQRWPARQLPDEETSWCDIEFTQDVTTAMAPSPIVEAGTRADVKSCLAYYDDGPGRIWIRRRNHEQLLADAGVYIITVLERTTRRVLRMALIDASTVDALIAESWWPSGDGANVDDEYRQLQWTDFFDSLDDPNGGDN